MTTGFFNRAGRAGLVLGLAAAALPGAALADDNSMSRGSGMAHVASVADSMSKAQIRKLQKALNRHGANIAEDGVMGPNTRDSLRGFQQRSGLGVTGRLDDQTLARLGLAGLNTNAGS